VLTPPLFFFLWGVGGGGGGPPPKANIALNPGNVLARPHLYRALWWPKFTALKLLACEPGSSVSTVSGYRLDDRVIEVRSPTEAKGFFPLASVQTSCAAHPASCTMGTGVLSPRPKRGRGVMLTTHPHLVPRSRMSRSYISSPPSSFVACSGSALASLNVKSRCVCVCFCPLNPECHLNNT
jgi:hypothetical protein